MKIIYLLKLSIDTAVSCSLAFSVKMFWAMNLGCMPISCEFVHNFSIIAVYFWKFVFFSRKPTLYMFDKIFSMVVVFTAFDPGFIITATCCSASSSDIFVSASSNRNSSYATNLPSSTECSLLTCRPVEFLIASEMCWFVNHTLLPFSSALVFFSQIWNYRTFSLA